MRILRMNTDSIGEIQITIANTVNIVCFRYLVMQIQQYDKRNNICKYVHTACVVYQ